MQYTAIFHGCKDINFQMKNCDIFLIFAQNIDCGYTLEPPQTSTHNLCFGAKIRKNVNPCKPQFYYMKVGCKGVFFTRTCFRDGNFIVPFVSCIFVMCVLCCCVWVWFTLDWQNGGRLFYFFEPDAFPFLHWMLHFLWYTLTHPSNLTLLFIERCTS